MANLEATTGYPVHLGYWTNWSHGRYTGSTITLTNRNGAILTSFLAIFITVMGTSFWRIVCFGLHQLYSSKVAQDGLYHQRQAILRNAGNESSSLFIYVRMLWTWPSGANGLKRLAPLLGLTLASMVLFAGAGTLASKFVQMSDELLISGPHCGGYPDVIDTIDKGFTQNTYLYKEKPHIWTMPRDVTHNHQVQWERAVLL